MNEARMAEQMARFAISGMQTTEQTAKFLQSVAVFFVKLMEKDETRQLILDFYNAGLEQQEKLKPGEKLGMLSYEIQPQYAKQLMDICNRDKIAYMNVKLNSSNLLDYNNNEHRITDSMLIYTTQQKDFFKAIAEAKARSGYEQEIPLEIATSFSSQLKEKNPMLQIKALPIEKYIMLRQDVQKLSSEMRFTLFPKIYEHGSKLFVDVGFLSQTEKLYDKRGNVYKEPQIYNIPQLVKGLLAKQKFLEINEKYKDPYESLQAKESFKQKIIEDVLKYRPDTISSIKKEIEEINFDEQEKLEIQNAISSFKNKKIEVETLRQIIDKQQSLSENAKINIKQKLTEIGKEIYIIPAKIIREGNEIEYQINRKKSLCIGKDLTVREAGKDDMIFDNEKSIRTNLNQKLTEYTEKGNAKDEFTFVVLSAKEFNEIENGNTEYILGKNRLKKKNINFLEQEENLELFKIKQELSKADESAEFLINLINQKKDRFILESDQTEYAIDRFDEYPESTIENIVMEEDFNMESEIREDIKEACAYTKDISILPVEFQGTFEQYMIEEFEIADEYQKSLENERDYDDRAEEFLNDDYEYYKKEQDDLEDSERENRD